MYWVYAIYKRKHNKIYIGQTDDLEVRLLLHNSKTFKKGYTARFDGEWKLIYKEGCIDRRSALVREKQLKSCRGRLFIRQQAERFYSGVAQW